jgi:hypothetical protein
VLWQISPIAINENLIECLKAIQKCSGRKLIQANMNLISVIASEALLEFAANKKLIPRAS